MSATTRTNRNARIATAIILVAFALAIPTVTAEDELPEQHDDETIGWGECFHIWAGAIPPAIHVDPLSCIPV